MKTFTPEPQIKNQLVTLLVLWSEHVTHAEGKKKKHKGLDDTLPVKKFLKLLNNVTEIPLTYDMLKKYVENVPAIEQLVGDLNKNTITIKDPDAEKDFDNLTPDQEHMPEPDAEEFADQEQMPAPDAEEFPVSEPTIEPSPEPAPAPAPAPVSSTGPNNKSIVAQMATRARHRAGK